MCVKLRGIRRIFAGRLTGFAKTGRTRGDLEITDDRRQLLRRADLIISGGFPDVWLGNTLTAQDRSERIIAVDTLESGNSASRFHGDLWLDPQIAIELTEAIREHLCILDDHHQDQYRQQATAYQKQLQEIDADCARQLAPFKGQFFLALRPTWAPFAARYGLQEIAPISTTPQKLTDDQIHQLQEAAVQHKTKFLAVESSLLPGIKRELQMRTGLTLIELDSVGTSASEGRSTYIRLMRYNLEQLCQGLR